MLLSPKCQSGKPQHEDRQYPGGRDVHFALGIRHDDRDVVETRIAARQQVELQDNVAVGSAGCIQSDDGGDKINDIAVRNSARNIGEIQRRTGPYTVRAARVVEQRKAECRFRTGIRRNTGDGHERPYEPRQIDACHVYAHIEKNRSCPP